MHTLLGNRILFFLIKTNLILGGDRENNFVGSRPEG